MKELKEMYFTEGDIANLLGIKPKTLANRRCEGKGHPPYINIARGGKVLYPKEDFFKWLNKSVVAAKAG